MFVNLVVNNRMKAVVNTTVLQFHMYHTKKITSGNRLA